MSTGLIISNHIKRKGGLTIFEDYEFHIRILDVHLRQAAIRERVDHLPTCQLDPR